MIENSRHAETGEQGGLQFVRFQRYGLNFGYLLGILSASSPRFSATTLRSRWWTHHRPARSPTYSSTGGKPTAKRSEHSCLWFITSCGASRAIISAPNILI